MTSLARLIFAVLFCLGAAPAIAHTKSETQSVWRVTGSTVRVAFNIPDIELVRLARPDGTQASEAELADYVRQNVTVLHQGALYARSQDVRSVAATTGFKRFEFAYQCPDAEGIAIHSSAFFALVPTHVTYAQIVTEKGEFISQLLKAGNETLDISGTGGESPLQNASFFEYIYLGIEHIFTG